MEGFVLFVFLVGTVLYLLPTIIAMSNNHSKSGLIFLVNTLIGWTLIGWIGCLVWAFIDKPGPQQDPTPKSKYQCRICSKTYSTLSNARIHIRTSHKIKGDEINKNILKIEREAGQ